MAGSALPAGLAAQIDTHQLTDREIRKIMRDASSEADRMIRAMEGKSGPGARLRSTQIALAKLQVEAWAGVGDAVRVGIGDAFDASALLQAKFDVSLFGKAGISPYYWEQAALAQSRAGIKSFIARKEFNYTLSQKVYRNQTLAQGQVEKAINNGLLLGKSAKEIAGDVKRFIDPRTPGGASSAAMRLGRTEVQNAFHTNSIKGYQDRPWVDRVEWHLSGSHNRPDQCNEYSTAVTFRNGQPGEWLPDDVPAKPHPNCLCYTTPGQADLDTYVKNFKAGKYDDYINEQMGCVAS